MKINEPIKNLTTQFVAYLNLTETEKHERKLAKRKETKERLTYSNKWFGMVPFVWRSMFKQK